MAWTEGPDGRVLAMVADTWDIDKCEMTWRGIRAWPVLARTFVGLSSRPSAGDPCVACTHKEVCWFVLKTISGGSVRGTYSQGGLVVWPQNHWRRFEWFGLKTTGGGCVCGTLLAEEVSAQTDGTWRHRRDCVDARLPVRRRGGRQIKM